jgi:phosphatidylethanolamine-binding protein (PEBP) family uncharacterized protein
MWTHRRTAPTHTTGLAGAARRLPAGLLLAALLLAGAIGALILGGCGESSGTPAAARTSTTAGSGASPTDSTTTGTTTTIPNAAASGATAPASGPARGSGRTAGHAKRAHLVLPPPGSHPEAKPSASEQAALPVTDISLSSTAITRQGQSALYSLAGQYTCHGSGGSPPLRWSGVPSNTRELALFVISTRPVNDKLYFDWALAGISPTLTGIQAGHQPPGAVAGLSSSGKTTYSICPPAGQHENYVFILYALPSTLNPKPGFDPATLRAQAKQIARHTGLLVGSYG